MSSKSHLSTTPLGRGPFNVHWPMSITLHSCLLLTHSPKHDGAFLDDKSHALSTDIQWHLAEMIGRSCARDINRACSSSCAAACSADIEDYALPVNTNAAPDRGSYILVDPREISASHEHPVLPGAAPRRAAARSSGTSISAPILWTDTPLSFWGGTSPLTGLVIDTHHPLHSQSLDGVALCMPSRRGSCSGSLALLELLLAGKAPKAILLSRADDILALGSVVAEILFGSGIPVLVLSDLGMEVMRTANEVTIKLEARTLIVDPNTPSTTARQTLICLSPTSDAAMLDLSPLDRAILKGSRGPAARQALLIILHMASLWRATSLLSVSSAHIDCCLYTGPASLLFARHFVFLGGHFAVRTTLNAISVDLSAWRKQGVDPGLGDPSAAIADAYLGMGAEEDSLTCAPYLLNTVPSLPTSDSASAVNHPANPVPLEGEHVGWAESNAVVYANSVLGARTQKYPDLLDVCIALTGRAPRAGPHLEEHRRPVLAFDLDSIIQRAAETKDEVWPLLGYHLGHICGGRIPIVYGLEHTRPGESDLKAFCAAFATTSSAPMAHIRGITPEASGTGSYIPSEAVSLRVTRITAADLQQAWRSLNADQERSVGLVALGNPHFALNEFERLCSFLASPAYHERKVVIPFLITCGRQVQRRAAEAGFVRTIEKAGGSIIRDTCWCMITEPVIPVGVERIMTNSAKYAHYGAGISGRSMAFGSLAECVEVALSGSRRTEMPVWLQSS